MAIKTKKKPTKKTNKKTGKIDIDPNIAISAKQLKELKLKYTGLCTKYASEPLLPVHERIDAAILQKRDLRELIFQGSELHSNQITPIRLAFKEYSNLTHFCLWQTQISHSGLKVLVSSLNRIMFNVYSWISLSPNRVSSTFNLFLMASRKNMLLYFLTFFQKFLMLKFYILITTLFSQNQLTRSRETTRALFDSCH